MTVKKIIAILSAAALTLTFCACSKRQSEFDSDTSSGMVEFLQKVSSDYGYTMEQQ